MDAPILISLHQDIEFHVHTNASNLVVEAMREGHERPRKQRLKERFKSNFQIKNKTRLCDSKNKNTRT